MTRRNATAGIDPDGRSHGGHVPLLVGRRGQRGPDREHEATLPLGTEPGATLVRRQGHRGIVLEVLGDEQPTGVTLGHLARDGGHEVPAILDDIRPPCGHRR